MKIKSSKKRKLICSLAEHPVNHSLKLENALDWMTHVVTWPLSFFALLQSRNPNGFYGKMSPEFCRAETETISVPLSKRWKTAGMASSTENWTLNISGLPKDDVGFSWLDILEIGDPLPQYSLSPKRLVTTLREAVRKRGVYLLVRPEMREMLTQEALLWLNTIAPEHRKLPEHLPRQKRNVDKGFQVVTRL